MYFLLCTCSCLFVYVHLCAHMCVGQRSVLAVFLDDSTPFVFIQGLSVNLELTDSNWLAAFQALRKLEYKIPYIGRWFPMGEDDQSQFYLKRNGFSWHSHRIDS